MTAPAKKRARVQYPADMPISWTDIGAALRELKRRQDAEQKAANTPPPPPKDLVREQHIRDIVRVLIPQAGFVTQGAMRMALEKRADIRNQWDRKTHPVEWEKARRLTSAEITKIIRKVWDGEA